MQPGASLLGPGQFSAKQAAAVGAGGFGGELCRSQPECETLLGDASTKTVTFILASDTISFVAKRVYVFAQLIVNALV